MTLRDIISADLPPMLWEDLATPIDAWINYAEVLHKTGLDYLVDAGPMTVHTPKYEQEHTRTQYGKTYTVPGVNLQNRYCTYRVDNGLPLYGIATKVYKVIQNAEAFQVLHAIVESGAARYEAGGVVEGGRRAFLVLRMNEETPGIGRYLYGIKSHDGTHSLQIIFSPVRLVCRNQLQAIATNTDEKISIRHTANFKDRLRDANKVIAAAANFFNNVEEEYNKLANMPFTVKDYTILCMYLTLTSEEFKIYATNHTQYRASQHLSTQKLNTIKKMIFFYAKGVGQDELPNDTALKAINALTGWGHIVKTYRTADKKFESVLYGDFYKKFLTKAMPYIWDRSKIDQLIKNNTITNTII